MCDGKERLTMVPGEVEKAIDEIETTTMAMVEHFEKTHAHVVGVVCILVLDGGEAPSGDILMFPGFSRFRECAFEHSQYMEEAILTLLKAGFPSQANIKYDA